MVKKNCSQFFKDEIIGQIAVLPDLVSPVIIIIFFVEGLIFAKLICIFFQFK